MIVTRLMGGVGNQMFQYAAGKRLANHLGVELQLDVSHFAMADPDLYSFPIRYCLDAFELDDPVVSMGEVAQQAPANAGRGRIEKLKSMLGRGRSGSLARIIERQFDFCPEILELGDFSYLDGYWQSQRYFEDQAEAVRNAFRFRQDLEHENADLAARMRSRESISVHVRRGDYVTNPVAADLLGARTIDYYHRAVAQIAESLEQPEVFVFSDDPEWVRDHLRLPCPVTHVEHNHGVADTVDMQLMSCCRHQVITNSSFGWWGAWLSENPDNKVVAPLQWFNDSAVASPDVIPPSWSRV